MHPLGLHNFDLAIAAGQALVAYAVTERNLDGIRLASSGGEVVVKLAGNRNVELQAGEMFWPNKTQ